jgi:hypothetical protein
VIKTNRKAQAGELRLGIQQVKSQDNPGSWRFLWVAGERQAERHRERKVSSKKASGEHVAHLTDPSKKEGSVFLENYKFVS